MVKVNELFKKYKHILLDNVRVNTKIAMKKRRRNHFYFLTNSVSKARRVKHTSGATGFRTNPPKSFTV